MERTGWPALSAWYVGYQTAIDHHHRAEEEVIYPALLARDPSFAEADAELEGEHRVHIDRLTVMRECLTALPAAADGSRWERERGDAVAAASALRDIVETHLDHEDASAFPRYAAASPPQSSTSWAGPRGSWSASGRSSSPDRDGLTTPRPPSGPRCSPPSRC